MGVILEVQNNLIIIFVTLVATGAVFTGLLIYFLKIKKIAAAEEKIDYNTFRRLDSTEYCKFKDIISLGDGEDSMGMVAMGDNVFVAGIDIRGFHYFAASAEEQQQTMANSIAFFQIVEHPIQIRQTVQAINISRNIEQEKERAREIEKQYLLLKEDIRVAVEAMQDNVDNTVVFRSIENRVRLMTRTLRSLEWQLQEARELVHYMEAASTTGNCKRIVHQLIFSYKFNPYEENEELTEEEIYRRAGEELKTKAMIYGGALESCRCSWSMLTADDLTDLLREHFHPVTGDEVPLEELLNSSYTSLFVSSDSLFDLEREKRDEQAYAEQMRMYEEQRAQMLTEARLKEEAVLTEVMREAAAMP